MAYIASNKSQNWLLPFEIISFIDKGKSQFWLLLDAMYAIKSPHFIDDKL